MPGAIDRLMSRMRKDPDAAVRRVADTALCPVPECGGMMTDRSDGNGRIVLYCTECERRLRRERLLSGMRVPTPAPAPLPSSLIDDTVLARLIAERFGTPDQVAEQVNTSGSALRAAAHAKALASAQVGTTGLLVISFEGARRWVENRQKGRSDGGGYWLALPSSASEAKSVRQLAQGSGIAEGKWSVWLSSQMARSGGTLRRHRVQGDRRRVWAYWRQS